MSAQGTAQLKKFLQGRENQCGIIYCLSRRKVEETTLLLQQEGIEARAYHAGLPLNERKRNQEDFLEGRVNIVVATIAFGMGIDKSNVRFVVHMDLPKNIENYYQETGRAGRDGHPSEVQLYYSARDTVIMKQMARKGRKEASRLQFELEALDSMLAFADSAHCRREVILQCFDEEFEAPCGQCDNCHKDPAEFFKATEWVKKMLLLYHQVKTPMTLQQMVDLARGLVTVQAREKGWFQLENFGYLMDHSEKGVFYGLRQMMVIGLIKSDWSKGGHISLTQKALQVLKGEREIAFTLNPKTVKGSSPKKKAAKKAAKKTAKKTTTSSVRKKKVKKKTLGTGAPSSLYEKLKEHRRSLSKKKRVPAFKIFHDQSLREMADLKPQTHEEMLEIYGVGDKKLKKYGASFLKLINDSL